MYTNILKLHIFTLLTCHQSPHILSCGEPARPWRAQPQAPYVRASSARFSDPERGRRGMEKRQIKRMKLVWVGRCPLWWRASDSARDDQPCLYFTADATRQRKGVVNMLTTLSWVSILLNYMHLNSIQPTSLRHVRPGVRTTGSSSEPQLLAITVLGGSALRAGTCTWPWVDRALSSVWGLSLFRHCGRAPHLSVTAILHRRPFKPISPTNSKIKNRLSCSHSWSLISGLYHLSYCSCHFFPLFPSLTSLVF